MPTTVTKSVGSGGGRDYANLGAFLAAVPLNLVTADQVWVAELYNDSEFTGGFNIANGVYTTDGSHYIKITAAAGQSFQDHANVRTNPLIYDQSKGVGITLGSSDTFAIDCAYTQITRLQIKRTAANGAFAVANCNVSGAGNVGIEFKDCILQKDCTGSGPVYQQYGDNAAYNLAILDTGAGTGNGVQLALGSSDLINCTIVQSTANSAHGNGIAVSYATSLIVRNCAVFGFATPWSGTPGSAFTDYNCSDGTCPTGSHNQNSKTYSNQFVSTTADWRLKTGADCINTGNTDATFAPNDISATARGATTAGDIGAWEFSSAAAVPYGALVQAANTVIAPTVAR